MPIACAAAADAPARPAPAPAAAQPPVQAPAASSPAARAKAAAEAYTAANRATDPAARAQNYSRQVIVGLDPGEEYVFTGHDGAPTTLRLISAEDHRDSVVGRVRTADVVVALDGRQLALRAGPYVMPTEAGRIRLQADLTSGSEPPLGKRVQFSIWDAADPIVDTAKFRFPLDNFELFSQGWQTFDEHAWMGTKLDGVGSNFNYHNYGVDISGYEARDEVHSPVAGTILGVWTEEPKGWDPGSVVIIGDDGLWWEAAHLDTAAANITRGARVALGDPIGRIGTRGPYSKNPEMHWGTYFLTGAKRWNPNRTLNLYPWFVTAYEAQYHKGLYAVPGGHQILQVDEPATFDGSNSLAFDSKIVGYRWVFSDGEEKAGLKVEKAFAAPGVYSAALWVEDDRGRRDVACCEARVFPRENPRNLPKIMLTCYPSRGAAAGEPVYFRGWIQGDARGPIQLDFGDGAPPAECENYAEIAHAYARPGIYLATARLERAGMPIARQIKLVVR